MPKKNHSLLHLLMERTNALSYEVLALLWVLVIAGSTGLYFILSSSPAHGLTTLANLSPNEQFWNSLYFSIITATTVGYGDITPLGFSRVVAAIESIAAFAIFAILVAKLVSHKQETRMERIEQLMKNYRR
ncbi:two pore domain potassium channel family protein [Candidatus Peregrinibacteria bacterium]|nr:two pore domain potassium channel family protein [Candidatus Peregrinibacteria bacterium]